MTNIKHGLQTTDETKMIELYRYDLVDDESSVIIDTAFTNDSGAYITLGGAGEDRQYYQFDTKAACYAADWFKKHHDCHGLSVKETVYRIPDDALDTFKV